MKTWVNILIFLFVAVYTTSAQAAEYRINPHISTVSFKLEHTVGFSTGFVQKFSGTLDVDEDKGQVKSLSLGLNMDSVNTFNEKRDVMLKGEGFFNTIAYPTVVMQSKKIKENTIEFEVIAKGEKKKVVLNYRFLGFANDVDLAKRKARIALSGNVSRSNLGVTHNVQDESGKNLLGDQLELFFELGAVE